MPLIWTVGALPVDGRALVGGKAWTLSHMRRAGYPVPGGFVIGVDAFDEAGLLPEAWAQIVAALNKMRRQDPGIAFAVRSSALEEDSQTASFAGEFKSVLNARTDEEIREAIAAVYQSQFSRRVSAYRDAINQPAVPNPQSKVSVIIQKMVPANYAGVLFTADPLGGSHEYMTGNYVRGLGEQLVSGEVNGRSFTLKGRPWTYDGPAELRPYAKQLFKLGERLAEELGGPQDIEWAIDDAGVHILQSRPVTTMQAYDPATGEWNDSRRGDYLWSNSNFGEAFPDVMTPLTWSLVQMYAEETFGSPLPGAHPLFGNIGGRLYMNLSLFSSIFQAFGMSRERMNYESEEFFGTLPEDVDVPDVSFSRFAVISRYVPYAAKAIIRRQKILRELDAHTADLPRITAELEAGIALATTPAALAQLWREEIEPEVRKAYRMLQAGTSQYENAYRPLQRQLLEQVGAEDANLLLSGVSSPGARLASLGPLEGLWQVANGELSREAYLHEYGHRGPHEMELSWPRPAEDPRWLDRRLASLEGTDFAGLLAAREMEQRQAWRRYQERYPREAAKTEKKLAKAAAAARAREAIRSQETRLYGVARTFALKAGELAGLGDDVFYLWLEELLDLLEGDSTAVPNIPTRRQAHDVLSALPPYPALINGRFNPQSWAADPHRRTDIYDAHEAPRAVEASAEDNIISGYPGSAGIAEGPVRLLRDSEEGHLLLPGEVVVTTTTNIGWTPLFPRAAAVVTDIGAPLSHAAIVARELGIPAVVGTGDATMRLKTGDRVRVNGAHGIVEKLETENYCSAFS